MKKLNILILSALTAVSGSALAMGGSIEQGKTLLTSIWKWEILIRPVCGEQLAENTDDGTQTGGVGAGYNRSGPVMLNAGAKAIYIGPKKAITA